MHADGLSALQTVTSTTVSPYLTVQEPWACLAILPVSIFIGLPAYSVSYCLTIIRSYSPVLFTIYRRGPKRKDTPCARYRPGACPGMQNRHSCTRVATRHAQGLRPPHLQLIS